MSYPFDSKLSMNRSWVKSVRVSKQPKEATLWRELRKWNAFMSMSSDICEFCTCVTGCPQFTGIWWWLLPEPLISRPLDQETTGSGDENAVSWMSVNCRHPVTHVQKLQISLLMLIMDFCPVNPSLLHWENNFTSRAHSRELLLWAVLKHVQTSLN